MNWAVRQPELFDAMLTSTTFRAISGFDNRSFLELTDQSNLFRAVSNVIPEPSCRIVSRHFPRFAFSLALTFAHRFRAASPIRFRASALIVRFGFAGTTLASFTAAHLFFCAAAIFLRAALLMVRRFGEAVAPSAVLPSLRRRSVMRWLMSAR
jgi:hypothetical protein